MGGVSAKALRSYDARGIFRPAWVDPITGYRYYSPSQLPGLRRIIALKDLGIPLAEVGALIVEGGDLRSALQRRRSELRQVRAEVDATLRALDIRVEMAETGPDVVVRTIGSQLVASIRSTVDDDDDIGPIFYELETAARDHGVRAALPPGALVIDGEGASDVEPFVPITRAITEGRITSRTLKPTRVATAIHHGSYAGMPEARDALEEWVAAAGYRQTDRLRYLYLQFGAEEELDVPEAYVVRATDDFVTEIQIPIG